jgi:hypothetical protein
MCHLRVERGEPSRSETDWRGALALVLPHTGIARRRRSKTSGTPFAGYSSISSRFKSVAQVAAAVQSCGRLRFWTNAWSLLPKTARHLGRENASRITPVAPFSSLHGGTSCVDSRGPRRPPQPLQSHSRRRGPNRQPWPRVWSRPPWWPQALCVRAWCGQHARSTTRPPAFSMGVGPRSGAARKWGVYLSRTERLLGRSEEECKCLFSLAWPSRAVSLAS